MRFEPWAASRSALVALALVGAGLAAVPAAAQDEARIRKIEAEIRALQRQVFPNGDGRFFTPEVVTPGAQPNAQPTNGLMDQKPIPVADGPFSTERAAAAW